MIKTNKASLLLFPVSAIGFQLLCILDLHETMVSLLLQWWTLSRDNPLQSSHSSPTFATRNSSPQQPFLQTPVPAIGWCFIGKGHRPKNQLPSNTTKVWCRANAMSHTRHKTNNFPVGNGHKSHKCLDEGQQFSVNFLFFLDRSICASPAFEAS